MCLMSIEQAVMVVYYVSCMSLIYRNYQKTLRHNSEINKKEINATKEAFVTNMCMALTNHIKTMKNGSKYDLLSVFRLVAIWFDNESRDRIRDIITVCIIYSLYCLVLMHSVNHYYYWWARYGIDNTEKVFVPTFTVLS